MFSRSFSYLFAGLLGLAAGSVSAADSASQASAASVDASVALPTAALELLQAGGQFSVAAVRPLASGMELVLRATGEGAGFSVKLVSSSLATSAVAVGSAVTVSAVAGGYLLSVAGELIAFVPSAVVEAHWHRRELRP